MRLFKKFKKAEISQHASLGWDKVASKIVVTLIGMQTKFSDRVSKRLSNMTIKKIKIIFIFFCLTTGGFSGYLIVNAITRPGKNMGVYKPGKLERPKYYDRTGDELILTENYINEELFYKIQKFKKYMDSLKQMKSYTYDSILKARPFLLDSIEMIEEIYYSQQQK